MPTDATVADLKLRTFKLTDATVADLDAVAADLERATGAPHSRTDALRVLARKAAEKIRKNSAARR